MPTFIDCSTVNISFDIMGIATVSYTIISDSPTTQAPTSMSLGAVSVDGYIASASMTMIPGTDWYETHITMVGTT